MATLIRSTGEKEEVKPAKGKKFSLTELQRYVGGFIEILNTAQKGKLWLVVNEEGKLKGLPVNIEASLLYERDTILGDVLLVERGEI